ncbi:MAG TPA: shikimate kinase [Dehalococcoidia bacterium]|nr:shikimate kinase [Dehalococcoidia bacterium]
MSDVQTGFRRVMVVGNSGAGKSSLGATLAEALEIPFVDLDDEFWGAGWQEPPDEAWRARVEGLIEPPAWLLAGNFGSTVEIRAPAADLVVQMSLPPALCVWRLVLRSLKIRFGRQIWRLPRDCRAGPDWEPMRDYPAFLLYTARWRRSSEPRQRERLAAAGVERLIRLRSSADVRRLLRDLEESDAPSEVLASWLTPLPA